MGAGKSNPNLSDEELGLIRRCVGTTLSSFTIEGCMYSHGDAFCCEQVRLGSAQLTHPLEIFPVGFSDVMASEARIGLRESSSEIDLEPGDVDATNAFAAKLNLEEGLEIHEVRIWRLVGMNLNLALSFSPTNDSNPTMAQGSNDGDRIVTFYDDKGVLFSVGADHSCELSVWPGPPKQEIMKYETRWAFKRP